MNSTDTKIFLDTNVIAYMFDSRDAVKQKMARQIFTELVVSQNCHISTQVLQELFNVTTKKLKYTKDEAQKIILSLLNLPVCQITTSNIVEAMKISKDTQFSIYDSLVLSAAKSSGCSKVYSEDLNDGQVVNGVKIVNPFK